MGIPIGKDCWEEEDDIYKLEAPFTEEEVKNAIWSLGVDKAQDRMAFQCCFSSIFWKETKTDIMNIMMELLEGEARLDRINYEFIVLIPKKEFLERLEEFKPTALLNSTLKIVSKILANKLASMLKSMIGDYQTGFIQERNIMKGVAIAQ